MKSNFSYPSKRWVVTARMTKRIATTCMLAISILSAGCATPKRSEQSNHWITGWGASSTIDPTTTYKDRTVRLIARSATDGDRARVRFSNVFGTQPLLISSAEIAIPTSGGAIQDISRRTLTFFGSKEVSIPPGSAYLSDDVSYLIVKDTDFSISFYLPNSIAPTTYHFSALQTSYIGSGNQVSTVDGGGFTQKIETWPIVDRIEVSSKNPKIKSVVAIGDSITDGFNSIINSNSRWTDFLNRRFHQAGTSAVVVNHGISGNRLLSTANPGTPRRGESLLARLDRDLFSLPNVTHAIVLIGINDIGFPAALNIPSEDVSVEQMQNGISQLVRRAHAKNIKVIGGTLTPFGGVKFLPNYFNAANENKRQKLNHWIREGGVFDEVIDFDKAIQDPKNPTHMLPIYDSGDHLHPSNAGYKAMADAINLSFFD